MSVENSSLIVAAPDLLAACRAVLDLYPQTYKCEPGWTYEQTHIESEEWKRVRAQVEAAVAKAGG